VTSPFGPRLAVQVLCPVLVGRDEEFRQLAAALAAMQAGRASTAWFALTYLPGHEHVRVYDGSWADGSG
jgi:hypothetical protein